MLVDENHVPLKHAAVESLKCLLNEDLRKTLDNINVPALFIHGREDRICVHEASHYMHNRIIGSKILIFENTGHAPFITKKYEVLAAINDFLGLCNEQNR
jgi:pimeloyl-[acyl-carrier protein] methyl ester esterase